MKTKLLFVISQFYKGGAEVSLLNLLKSLSEDEYEVDFLIFDQIILKNAYSLVSEIPSWINICNAAESEGRLAIINKVINKLYLKLTKKQRYRKSAQRFIKNKKYDYAFSVGEWMSPEFVAKMVHADKKAIWIHTDIDKAKYVDPRILLGYDDKIDKYIFVSAQSMESAIDKYPQLKEKSVVIYNMLDDEKIKEMSKETVEIDNSKYQITLLSVANLRDEKNYPRQVEVMNLLSKRGLNIRWLAVGSKANPMVYNQVEKLIQRYRLENQFILLGVDQNPYKYMSKVDAVTVLSDFESWSMVITEAKLLGIPVIATKTSGAIEQIKNNETGILTEFTVESIADEIERFILDDKLKNTIRSNLLGFSTKETTIQDFQRLIER